MADALTGGYVTEKGGRYCLPVRTDRRELLGGLLHERSGSGQTIFVEPLAVVEDNNALAEAIEEEREEVHRILVALTARFSSRREELLAAVEVLTELDAYQARAEFSSRVAGVFPDFSDRLVLRGARHPLLDRRLADLRAEVFGEREERHADAVPLDLELPEGSRLLLLSGPNAGGKSVAMKTVGLFALLAQSGFAIPAAPGSTLPVFDQVLVVAGDAQDLLGDLSSFAAAMTRTARVLAEATPRSLVLIDELGSGTDPDEGAALAIAVLEEDLARGGITVATTHLAVVKEWAQERPGVLVGCDGVRREGGPAHVPRAPGHERALACARRGREGGPAGARPFGREEASRREVGDGRRGAHAPRDRDAARPRRGGAGGAGGRGGRRASRRSREGARPARGRTGAREGEGEGSRSTGRSPMLREKTRQELERMREDLKAGRSISRGALMTVTQSAREAALSLFGGDEEPSRPAGPVAVGMEVRVASLGTSGRLLALDAGRGEAEVEVKGKRLKVSAASAVSGPCGSCRSGPNSRPRVEPGRRLPRRRLPESSPLRRSCWSDSASTKPFRSSRRRSTMRCSPARAALRLVHGHGTGRLAAAVREFLQTHPGVASYRWGDAQEGGQAVTIARLDV